MIAFEHCLRRSQLRARQCARSQQFLSAPDMCAQCGAECVMLPGEIMALSGEQCEMEHT